MTENQPRAPIPFDRDPVILADGDRMLRRITPASVDAHAPAQPSGFLPQGPGREIPDVRPARPRRDPLAGRVVRRPLPTPAPPPPPAEIGSTWDDIVPDQHSRDILHALFSAGFERGDIVENRAYMVRGRDVVVLVVNLDDPLRFVRVIHGQTVVLPTEAAHYIRERWGS